MRGDNCGFGGQELAPRRRSPDRVPLGAMKRHHLLGRPRLQRPVPRRKVPISATKRLVVFARARHSREWLKSSTQTGGVVVHPCRRDQDRRRIRPERVQAHQARCGREVDICKSPGGGSFIPRSPSGSGDRPRPGRRIGHARPCRVGGMVPLGYESRADRNSCGRAATLTASWTPAPRRRP